MLRILLRGRFVPRCALLLLLLNPQKVLLLHALCIGPSSTVLVCQQVTQNDASMQLVILHADIHVLLQNPMHALALVCLMRVWGWSRYAQGHEGAVVSHMLDEVVAAAVERSLEPILLDGHILDRLASAPPAQ